MFPLTIVWSCSRSHSSVFPSSHTSSNFTCPHTDAGSSGTNLVLEWDRPTGDVSNNIQAKVTDVKTGVNGSVNYRRPSV